MRAGGGTEATRMTAFEDADWISLAKTPFTMQRPISTPYMSHQTGTSLAWIAVRRAMWNHWVSTVPRRLYPHHLLPPLRVLYDTLFPTPRRHRALFSRLLLPTIPRIQAFCDAPPYRSRRRKIPYFMLIPMQPSNSPLYQDFIQLEMMIVKYQGVIIFFILRVLFLDM